MLESLDPEMKLFGKTIQLRAGREVHPLRSYDEVAAAGSDEGCRAHHVQGLIKLYYKESNNKNKDEEDNENEKKALIAAEQLAEEQGSSNSINPATVALNVDKEGEEEEEEEGNVKEKPSLKKPDKILQCPRCSSQDTKFCYYNNYNLNQPRHFCRKCQRYWTAGGSMRNVPVGAGRRKTKSSPNHHHHIALSDAMQGGQQHSKSEGDADFPVQEDQGIDAVSNSPVEARTRTDEEDGDVYPALPRVACYPPPQWCYPWNLAQWRAPLLLIHAPSPFFPATAYWGCAMPAAWGVGWVSPRSPTLGKHCREEKALNQRKEDSANDGKHKSERCLWVPKTLRIDDPEAAAKSSIWSTLKFSSEKGQGTGAEGIFSAFPSIADQRNHGGASSTVLLANPAALSRSLSFRETS